MCTIWKGKGREMVVGERRGGRWWWGRGGEGDGGGGGKGREMVVGRGGEGCGGGGEERRDVVVGEGRGGRWWGREGFVTQRVLTASNTESSACCYTEGPLCVLHRGCRHELHECRINGRVFHNNGYNFALS